MYHGLVYYTNLDNQQISDFRQKYDPTVGLIDDHLTIVFPVPDKISETYISKHIKNVLNTWKPFDIHINSFIKTWDHWFFLTLKEGNEEVTRLYNELYVGILKPYYRPDLFIPHIGIGYVGKGQFDIFNPHDELDEDSYQKAQNDFKHIEVDYWRRIDKLTLVSISDELKELKNLRDFIF